MLDGRLPGYWRCGGRLGSSVPKARASAWARAVGRQVLLQAEVDEVAGHDLRALVQELVERMLAHRAFGAPQHRRGGVVERRACRGRRACRSIPSRAAAGTAGSRRSALDTAARRASAAPRKLRVPHADERHQRGDVFLQRRAGEVLVDLARRRRGTRRTRPCRCAHIAAKPTADHTEKRPPTQSHIGKDLARRRSPWPPRHLR